MRRSLGILLILFLSLLAIIYLEQKQREIHYPSYIKELLDETCQCSGLETIQAITLKLQNLQTQSDQHTKTLEDQQQQIQKNTDYINNLQKKIIETQKEIEQSMNHK